MRYVVRHVVLFKWGAVVCLLGRAALVQATRPFVRASPVPTRGGGFRVGPFFEFAFPWQVYRVSRASAMGALQTAFHATKSSA